MKEVVGTKIEPVSNQKSRLSKEQLKTVAERREKCWAVSMERRTTLKTGDLGNSSFPPETTEIWYKNVSNVSQNVGGQAVHTQYMFYAKTKATRVKRQKYGIKKARYPKNYLGAEAAHLLSRKNHVEQ